MEIRQLRQFLVLAEELHFGNAAKRLNMAQPPFSQSIRRLEVGLGFDLFNRSSRKVELTDAGRAFVEDARKALFHLDVGARLAKRISNGETASLNVGFVSTALLRALPAAIRSFQKVAEGANLRLHELSSRAQITGLLDGSLDIGFVVRTSSLKLEGLSFIPVERSKSMAAVPAGWPIAERAEIKLADLADAPFVLPPYSESPAHHMAIVDACRRAGFTPRVAQEASQLQTLLSLVEVGLGVAFASESAAAAGKIGVRFIPIADMPESLNFEIVATWSEKRESVALKRFLAVIEGMRVSSGP